MGIPKTVFAMATEKKTSGPKSTTTIFNELKGKHAKPTVVIVGRGKIGSYKCDFDLATNHPGLTVLKIDVDPSSGADMIFDFNDAKSRKEYFQGIRASGLNVIMIQLDLSVFKFLAGDEEMFLDNCDLLVRGGLFIFPFEPKGGGVGFSASPTTAMVDGLHSISIPYATMLDIFGKKDATKELEEFKADVKGAAQQKILIHMNKIFGKCDMYQNAPYPFFEKVNVTNYVCQKR